MWRAVWDLESSRIWREVIKKLVVSVPFGQLTVCLWLLEIGFTGRGKICSFSSSFVCLVHLALININGCARQVSGPLLCINSRLLDMVDTVFRTSGKLPTNLKRHRLWSAPTPTLLMGSFIYDDLSSPSYLSRHHDRGLHRQRCELDNRLPFIPFHCCRL
ncbi:hypothetical protein H4582DRAFT_373810 [Lactarius indigo]|nr:hypothetical protein H4582DRAFT_373810 [Lactarius indigo]